MVGNTRRGAGHLSLIILDYTDKKAKLTNLPIKLLYHTAVKLKIYRNISYRSKAKKYRNDKIWDRI